MFSSDEDAGNDPDVGNNFDVGSNSDVGNNADGNQPQNRQGRPKKGRKRKFLEQSRADRKRLCNTNKTHRNCKGQIKEEKLFDEDFVCGCRNKCTNRVPLESRKRLFNQFCSMGTFEGRCALIVSCVSTNRYRHATHEFSIYEKKVCKKALLRTLQINYSRVKKALEKQSNCDSYKDLRGQAQGGFNAVSVERRDIVISHIESFPLYVSHYTRNQTSRKFLRSDLNLAILYRLYEKHCEDLGEDSISLSYYKNIFYTKFDLKFKKPKKDTCSKCDSYIAQIKDAVGSERQRLEDWHNEHLEKAKVLRNHMKADLEIAKTNDEIETLTYDLQKTLILPKVPTNIAYYKRQLNLFNFGIHVGSISKGIFNVWVETEASRGTQEVGSCLRKYIQNISAPTKKLILWSDSCGGQNRSIKLVLMMIHLLQNHSSLETISLRYLQPGHSFLPNDSEFGDVECYLKSKNIFTDVEYMKEMRDCRIANKFIINRLSRDDFLSVKKLEESIVNRKVDIEKSKINWLQTHEIIIEKSNPFVLKMAKTVGGDYQTVSILKVNRHTEDFKNIVLDILWPNGRPLSIEKAKDLKDLLKLVPDYAKTFYSFLENVRTVNFIDDVDGFGESVDFDVDEYDE